MTDLWDEATKTTGQIDAAEETAKAVRQRSQEKLEEIRQRIRDGETSDNPLSDFVLMTVGVSEEALAKLQALDENLRAHIGDLILVVQHDEQHHGCTGFGARARPENYHRDEWLTLAVIQPDGLRIIRGETAWQARLPIDRHVEWETTRSQVQPQLKTDPRCLHGLWRSYGLIDLLDRPISYTNSMSASRSPDDKRLEIYVGREAVEGFFVDDPDKWYFLSGRPYITTLQRMAKVLNFPVSTEELDADQKASAEEALGRLDQEFADWTMAKDIGGRVLQEAERMLKHSIEVIDEARLDEQPLVTHIRAKLSETAPVS